jgi:hypothetical protein
MQVQRDEQQVSLIVLSVHRRRGLQLADTSVEIASGQRDLTEPQSGRYPSGTLRFGIFKELGRARRIAAS